jgi:hypothetical protein
MPRLIYLMTALGLAACSAETLPQSSAGTSNLVARSGTATLLVNNSSAHAIHLSGMPDFHPAIPQPSWGVYSFATAAPGATCLVLPAEIDDSVRNFDTGETGILRWTDTMTIAFTIMDPTPGLEPSEAELSQTDFFAPVTSPGWTLNVDAAGAGQVSAGAACTPR